MQISNYKSLLVAAIAASLALSCSKETAGSLASNTQTAGGGQTFFATRENVVSDDKATFNNGIVWQVNDEIAVNDGTNTSIYKATAVDANGKATFTLKAGETPLKTSGVTYRAWYPTSIAPDKTTGKMVRPQLTTNTNGAIPSGKTVNYAPAIYSDNPMYCESSSNTLAFKNLCGLLKITYDDESAGYALHRQIFESAGSPLWGEYTIVGGKMVLSGDAERNRRAELRNTNAKYVSQNGTKYVTTYYYAIPAGTYNSLSFMPITNTNTTTPLLCQINGLRPGQTITVERNKVYAFNIKLNDMRTDLSKDNSTANCYPVICEAGKKVLFKATRGNETAPIPNIKSAGILWKGQASDSNDLTVKVIHNVSYKNGYILFESTSNQGNAVIAAYDGDDCTGNILWSWHIWTYNSARPLKDIKMGEKTFLSRNLGAYYDDQYTSGKYNCTVFCGGLLYQWGRKDPFGGRGKEALNSGSPILMLDNDNNECKKVVEGPVTVITSVRHPDTFYSSSAGHWASDAANTWGGNAKTIYDPCPYGYRVPAKADFPATIWSKTQVTVIEGQLNAEGNPTGVMGFRWTVNGTSTLIAVTGQLNNISGDLNHAYIGTDTPASTTASRQAVCRMWTRESNHTWIDANRTFSNGKTWEDRISSVSNTSSSMNPYAFAVRCVKE